MLNGQGWRNIPPVTKNLIIINFIIWFASFIFPNQIGNFLMRWCALHFAGGSDFNPVQVFTYMFMHDDRSIMHILFNMFSLYMFGRILEQVWGSRRFFIFYLVCGVGAALVQEAVWALTWKGEFIGYLSQMSGMTRDTLSTLLPQWIADADPQVMNLINQMKNSMVTVGASGAIFGILLGFAFVFPNLPLYLWFIPVPIKAKYMVAGYAVIEFFFGVAGAQSTVAHFAHLGGMLFGLILILIWKKQGKLHGNRFF